jgi:uncharacterized membrane protein YccC
MEFESLKSELIRLHTLVARIDRMTGELSENTLTAHIAAVFDRLMERQHERVDNIYEAFNQAERTIKADAERNERFAAILASIERVNEELRNIERQLSTILGKD